MTIVSAFGLLFSLAAITIASRKLTFYNFGVFFFLLLVHIAVSLFYYSWSLTVATDAWGYYFDPAHLAGLPWSLGSQFVTKLCYLLKASLGATYLDCFMLFQAFGFAGIMMIARIIEEVEDNLVVPHQRGYLLLLFLPSVQFWTSAIGKDAPLFLAVAMSLWSVLSVRRRLFQLCLALTIMVLFRPHVALIALIAFAAASSVGTSISFGRRIGLLALACVGIWFASGAVQSTFGVDTGSMSSISDYLDKQTIAFATDKGTTSIGKASFMVRLVSLLFRPFFFDAHGGLGLIASVENVGVLVAVLYMIIHWRDLAHLATRVFFIRFALIYMVGLLLLLSLIYYNVGLGLRERVMAYPMFYSILIALWSMRRRFEVPQAAEAHGGLIVRVNADTALAKH